MASLLGGIESPPPISIVIKGSKLEGGTHVREPGPAASAVASR